MGSPKGGAWVHEIAAIVHTAEYQLWATLEILERKTPSLSEGGYLETSREADKPTRVGRDAVREGFLEMEMLGLGLEELRRSWPGGIGKGRGRQGWILRGTGSQFKECRLLPEVWGDMIRFALWKGRGGRSKTWR